MSGVRWSSDNQPAARLARPFIPPLAVSPCVSGCRQTPVLVHVQICSPGYPVAPKRPAQLRLLRTSRRNPTVPLVVDHRLEHLEAVIDTIQQTLDVQFKRMAAMQAELDLLRAAKSTGKRRPRVQGRATFATVKNPSV